MTNRRGTIRPYTRTYNLSKTRYKSITRDIADAWDFGAPHRLELALNRLPDDGFRTTVGKGYESPLEVRGFSMSDHIYTRRPINRREDER